MNEAVFWEFILLQEAEESWILKLFTETIKFTFLGAIKLRSFSESNYSYPAIVSHPLPLHHPWGVYGFVSEYKLSVKTVRPNN